MTQEVKGCGRIQPNDKLKQERQRRGWSRGYVAEQIGIADPKTIGRWERGAAFPSAYFLQRLCSLFEKLPHELGLLQEETQPSLVPSSTQTAQANPGKPATSSAAPIFDPMIPLPHAETDGLVARDEVLQQLKELFCRKRGPALVSLYGLPGVGKTALAVELAYDGEMQQRFHDGILWATAGPESNVLEHLQRWGDLLGLTEAERLTTVEAWKCAIRAAIGMRKLLIIIDDVWATEDARAFNIGGPNCSYLLTTRLPPVALHFANANALHIREWSEEEGLQLLARFAPTLVARDEPTARGLVRAVGGLPLGITLVGKYCRDHGYGGQQRRLHAALERLKFAEERLRLSQVMCQMRTSPESRGVEPDQTLISLEKAIATSYRHLDEHAQYMLSQLAVFPTGQNGFSEEAALAVSAMSIETLDALVDAGLLDVIAPGRYSLHPTIADYGRIQCNLTATYRRMVAYFVRYAEIHAIDNGALNLEQWNIQEALRIAFAHSISITLSTTGLQEAVAFASFLQEHGYHEQAAWYLQQIEQAIRQSNRRSLWVSGRFSEWPVAAVGEEDQLLPVEHMPPALMQVYQQPFDNRLLAPVMTQKKRPQLLTGPPSLS